MKAITDTTEVKRYQKLASSMMLEQKNKKWEFNPDWIRSRGWKIVPTESMSNFSISDIPRIISVLKQLGCRECIVIATEDFGDMPTCYRLSVDEADFLEYRRQLGLFLSLLTTEERAWCISCTDSFNLFAGEERVVSALLGKSISEARQEFMEFANAMAKDDPSYPLLKMAEQWASL